MTTLSDQECAPDDIALKSFFLGPQAENAAALQRGIDLVVSDWIAWRRELYPNDGEAISPKDKKEVFYRSKQNEFKARLEELLERYQKEIPKFSPRYMGHMFSEISIPSILGHFVALIHNPNNLCSDSSRVGLQIEKEAIKDLSKMLQLNPDLAVGHFTSGGTIANFEALHRARHRLDLWLSVSAGITHEAADREPPKTIFEAAHCGWAAYDSMKQEISDIDASEYSFVKRGLFEACRNLSRVFQQDFKGPVFLVPMSKHYCWTKAASLMGFSEEALWLVELDKTGRLDLLDLETKLHQAERENRPVLMVVSVAGTTELGEVDPVGGVQDVLDRWKLKRGVHIWHHVDAAYGGFFCSVPNALNEETRQAFQGISRAESLSLDPHKLGYVPYSCGSFICADERNYLLEEVEAPYVFSQGCKEPGLYTIEGSRAATGPTATWLTSKTLGFTAQGIGRILEKNLSARKSLEKKLHDLSCPFLVAPFAQTNVLCLALGFRGENLSLINKRTEHTYSKLSADSKIFVSKTILSKEAYRKYIDNFSESWGINNDCESLFLIRMCLMNPFLTTQETNIGYIDFLVETLKKTLDEECL